ncbi:hypothetical protein CAV8706_0545 [Campylobacter avium]|uniref:hypothetical protein n=1 Tax=Campylobacter avium TaxID=522485 RepID=UPI000B95085A|nr:hypothetical protein [Campylobacter avium]OYD79308.1 hypothetical protein CAV8706_0545 [Campylobacter avium]
MRNKKILVEKLPFFKYIRLAIVGSLLLSITLNISLYVQNLALSSLLSQSLNASKEVVEDITKAKIIEMKEGNKSLNKE